MYVKHPNKHNDQKFNVKAILQKKEDSNPCQIWSDLINICKFDNAITFTFRSLLLFWYLDNFLEKDESGLLFQMTIAWSVLIGMINWRGLHLSHIWTIHLFWVYMLRFALGLLYFFRYHFVFLLVNVMLDERFVYLLHIFMFFASSWKGEQKV